MTFYRRRKGSKNGAIDNFMGTHTFYSDNNDAVFTVDTDAYIVVADFSSIVAEDTITINYASAGGSSTVLTAKVAAAASGEFTIGASDAITATNLVTTINSLTTPRWFASSSTDTVTLKGRVYSMETDRAAAFTVYNNTIVLGGSLTISGGLRVDGFVDFNSESLAIDTDIEGTVNIKEGLTVQSNAYTVSLASTIASDFTVTGAGADLTLESVSGSVVVQASEAIATAITLNASAGGIAHTSALGSTWTHSGGAWTLNSTSQNIALNTLTSGSIVFNSIDDVNIDAPAGNDILLDAGQVLITGLDNVADAIYLHTNVNIAETIRIHSEAGTGTSAVALVSTLGGVSLSAGLASAGAISIGAAAGGINHTSALGCTWTHSGGAWALNSTSQNITLATITGGNIIFTGAGILDADFVGASHLIVDSGNMNIQTTTSGDIDINAFANLDLDGGTVDITSAAGLNLTGVATVFTTTGAVTWTHSGGAFAVNSTSQNIGLNTITAGDIDISAVDDLDLDGGTVNLNSVAGLNIGGVITGITTTGAATWTHSGGAFAVNSTSQNIGLNTITTGDIDINAVDDLDLDGGTVNLNSAAGLTIGGVITGITTTGASTWTHSGGTWTVSSTSQNLDLTTLVGGDININSVADLDLDGSTVAIDSSAAMTIISGNTMAFTATSATTSFTCTGQAFTVDGGGLSLDGTAASNFSVSGAGIDLTLLSAGGSVVVDGGEAVATAVTINATSGGLDVNLGTGFVASFDQTVQSELTNGVVPAFDASQRGTVSGRAEEGAYRYKDHFSARVSKAQWATDGANNDGDINAVAPASDDNGRVRIRSNAVAGNVFERHWNDVFNFDTDEHTSFDWYFIPQGTVGTDFQFECGLIDAAETSYMRIFGDFNNDTTWHLQSSLAGAPNDDDSAVAMASGTYVKFRVEVNNNGGAAGLLMYVDGALLGSMDAANIPASGTKLQPYYKITSRAGGAGVAAQVDLDKFELWNDQVDA